LAQIGPNQHKSAQILILLPHQNVLKVKGWLAVLYLKEKPFVKAGGFH
jgi:hypothetical protein